MALTLFGVTGGVGMGKSTVAQWLRQHHVAVADTDAIAHRLTGAGQPALAAIAGKFGPNVIFADGSLNRRELARVVFSDVAARTALEGILHPAIRSEWQAEIEQWRRAGRELGAVIIPLLFETKAAENFDATICVACSAATQQSRLRERGWTPEEIAARVAAQWPIEQKINCAYFVVWTDAALEATGAQLAMIIDSVGIPRKIPACA